ncbi:potassium-transporting ATPase subunit KdpA [Saccharibacillus sp. CPCC 101409]|uniref:potassium-transporting ATPase subunit KdpA n=1 Tax=Saccharibacillus sp. CPCC 101409 TaxID=3058041 RepID=UPI002671D89E|nr:potassium-transporting ATPase subunit KdpA [Saccharibacillus sp. CPCC 101409]MDO3411594.1 potassium-transporting ATPase subunit KdpA [Saccharibacillus sp. CPCC 101409]
MTTLSLISIAVTLLIAVLLAKPVGLYLAAAFDYGPNRLNRVFGPLERLIYRISGFREENQSWKSYAAALVVSNAVMILLVYLVLRFQGALPLNPAGVANMEPSLAFNTAISFMANTDLQHYSGESGVSYLSQATVLVFSMFVSPATGLALAMAFIRGLSGKGAGNFFADLIRALTRVLLPVAFVSALLFVFMGVPQTFESAATATTLEGAQQTIARGPIASFLAIKELGNNGGGFLGVNSAHPFENPSGLSNLLQILLMLLVTSALPFAYGKMVGSLRQGRVLFVSMLTMLIVMTGVSLSTESAGNPVLNNLGIQHEQGSMEGKEVRLGEAQSAFYSVITTAAETGAVNTMHDTLTPIGGMVPLANMMLNTVFGGMGVGFVNVLMYALIAVFLSGLMVGRTPEFLGRKIEGKEMKLIAVTLLVQPFLILVPTAIALATNPDTISNPGFHGLTQALYEFTSAAANNGSGFEGLGDATTFWNVSTGIVMYLGRYISMVTLLAVAGSLAAKKPVPAASGTFRTDTAMFGAVFVGIVLIVGALTFFPALVLGPIAEQLTL